MANDEKINQNQYPYPVAPSQPLTEKDLKTLAQRKAEKKPQEPAAVKKEEAEKTKAIKLEEAKKLKREKSIRPLLRYYNSELLIPVSRTQIVPGNCYVFSYSAYDHVPTPIVFYIGTDPRYNTLEGISLQYLSTGERKRLFEFFRKTELHSDKMLKGSLKIRSLLGEDRHIFRRSYSSDSIYNFMRKKMSEKVLFYRRYKFSKISSRIYVVPIEALDRALEVNTPVKPISPQKIEESKKHFGRVINQLKQYRH
jgi:hypothetical protein